MFALLNQFIKASSVFLYINTGMYMIIILSAE